MIKAIATDLDGTLFYPKKRLKLISKKNRQFIQNAISQDKKVILVTGRNYYISKRVEKRINVKDSLSFIGCNGAIIYDQGKIIHENTLNKKKVLELYETLSSCKDVRTWIFMGNDERLFMDTTGLNIFEKFIGLIGLTLQCAYFEPFKISKKNVKKLLVDDQTKFYKVMPWFGLGKKAEKKAQHYIKLWKEQYADDFEFFDSKTVIEISPKGTDKAKSLKIIMDKYDISDDEIAVVGDSGNDIPLFKTFKNSFVMSHASSDVKLEAKVVLSSFDELNKYINKGENYEQ